MKFPFSIKLYKKEHVFNYVISTIFYSDARYFVRLFPACDGKVSSLYFYTDVEVPFSLLPHLKVGQIFDTVEDFNALVINHLMAK